MGLCMGALVGRSEVVLDGRMGNTNWGWVHKEACGAPVTSGDGK